MLYDCRKKKVHVTLTPTALANLAELAKVAALSRSETLERLLRHTPAHEGLVLNNANWLASHD